MDIVRVISENVKATYSNEGNAVEVATRGRFLIDGNWYHITGDGGERFVEGQSGIEGQIVEFKTGGTDGHGNWVKYNSIGFEPDKKYRPHRFSYLFFENRRIVDKVLGNFVGDCVLCGAKGVATHEHAMEGCPDRHKGKVNAIIKEQDKYHNQIRRKAAKAVKARNKPRKKERRYEMKFKIKNSCQVGLTSSFKNREEALNHAIKDLKATNITVKFVGWK